MSGLEKPVGLAYLKWQITHEVAMRAVFLLFALLVSACTLSPATPPSPEALAAAPAPVGERAAARNFLSVVERVEPVAERECRQQTRNVNCDFLILVDDRRQPPNAFQTVDDAGRPVIVFTLSLIRDARNVDELAFVMSHEAAHHIEGHLSRQQQNAQAGAAVFAELAALTGATGRGMRTAQEIGALVGARTFSKEFELEADALGTVITSRAGYDPLVGAQFFNRIPDPGDQFLGTHPPNAERLRTVERVAATL